MAKVYSGFRTPEGAKVYVDGRPLPPRFDLRNHSPSGFEWGYGGSGPAQLALAILADYTGDDALAERAYQDFKSAVVAKLREASWSIDGRELREWLNMTGLLTRN